MEKIFGGVQNHSGEVNKYSGGVRTPPENPSLFGHANANLNHFHYSLL